jgi:hypothetical protein
MREKSSPLQRDFVPCHVLLFAKVKRQYKLDESVVLIKIVASWFESISVSIIFLF